MSIIKRKNYVLLRLAYASENFNHLIRRGKHTRGIAGNDLTYVAFIKTSKL